MRTNTRLRLTRHFWLFFTGIVLLWLLNSVCPILAQDLNWLPTTGVTTDPTNWFEGDNWQPNTSIAPAPPTPTQSASVNITTIPGPGGPIVAIATIGPQIPGATANELVIGGLITINTPSFVSASGTGGVIVSGMTASLTLSGTGLGTGIPGIPSQLVSLDVVSGSLLVEGGATLTSSGSGVGRIARATTAGTVTVTGAGSTWIENGTLDIGLANSAQVVISDGASFRGTGTVTIESGLGTLAIGTGGLAGIFNAPSILNNGVMNFNFTDTSTLTAQVSGTGNLTKLGTGTLFLTGNNTYSGQTMISGGTIQLGNGGTTGSITSNVADNGTLAFDRSNVLSFGGVISGTGSVQQIGTGTTVLLGNNTYAGGTTIQAGTLQLGNGGTTGSITGNVTDNSILVFDLTNVLTFGGVISGTGAVQQIGTGTTVLLGDNTYAGGTTINAGTLQLGNGSTAGSITGNVTDNGILAFNRSNVLIFGGVISGTGAVQQIGTGTTVLFGDNTYARGTTINAGTLQLGNGGTTGSITGNVTDDGILAFNRSNVLTFGGVISGTGSVQQIGTGTTVLLGDSSYAGISTINAGTLQLGNGGTTGSITGNVTDSGILAFDRSNVFTFGGVISGTGSVQQIGTGTTVLLGDSTYAGGTTITAGTLQLGNGGTTGSITGNVTDNGILAFDRSNVLTFGGVISGTGSVQQIGTGTTVLLGDNTYAGITTINAGTLQLGNGGATGGITGNVTDNGILAFDRNNALTFGGVISGTGAVQQIGTGTTVLLGDNTYAGGTTINAGTLQLGNGGTTGSITGNVTDNSILAFDRSNVLTFGGVISGTGSVQQNGPGTTVLDGKNTYTGATTVNAGSLIVDGSIASVQTLVNPGGLLGGRGSIGSLNGNLVNSGIVRPGDSPGTLTVNGNYTQTAAGTLRIEVASVTEHGLLAVGGHASLAGTLQLIGLGGFTLHVGDQFTFLTANGGVSGTFGTIQNEISTGTVVQAQVVTLPNAAVLEGTQGSFVPAACNPNSAAVAQALDSAVGNPRASALIAFLNEQAFNNLCGDFTLIAPEALASIFDAGVSFANVQTANLKRRMEDVRAGDNGFNSSGFSLNGGASNISAGLSGVTGPEGKSGPSVMAPTPENRWGIWVTGIGEFANVSSTNEAAGFNIQTGGVTFGVDYRVCSIFAIGLTAGYANMNADLPNGGSLDVNSGQFGLYATLFGKGFYADAAITGGPSGYDSRRTALLGSANGNTGGGNFNTLIAVGYDWTKGGLSVGPTANFQYTYVGISGFTESGSIAPLNIDSQNVESERTAIGMKASYEWKVGHVIIKPEISAAWQHEFGDQSYSIVSSFANGAGNSFTVSSPSIGRDSLLIGAGTAVLLNDRLSIYAYYDGELLRTNYQSNDVSAGVRLTF